MIELKRNDSGEVEAWKDGKKIGIIVSMGDEVSKEEVSDGSEG